MELKWIYDPDSNCIVLKNGSGLSYENVIDGECIKDRETAERLAELENLYPENSWYKQLAILIHEGLIDGSWADSDPNDSKPNRYFVEQPQ